MRKRKAASRSLSEFDLITQLFAPLAAAAPGAFGLTDDVARIAQPPGTELFTTTDTLISGVHFRPEDSASDIARKALRVNLSDLASKGCDPAGYLLALSIPKGTKAAWLKMFAEGLASDQKVFGIHLLGGDTTATQGPLTITITAFGTAPRGTIIKRSGAIPGDFVFVSGQLGDGAAGLKVLQCRHRKTKARAYLAMRYVLPTPRLALGKSLRKIATASLDVSDGLVADLGHIAEASKVTLTIDLGRIPLSPGYRKVCGISEAAIIDAVTGGDDYEIAFTAPAKARAKIALLSKSLRLSIAEIGEVSKGHGVTVMGLKGQALLLKRRGYTHF